MKNNVHKQKGFTLIEIIVAVAIFVIVIMIAIGAVLTAVDANRKAQSLNVVVNNLNLTFESMIRDIRTGNEYESCGTDNDCVRFVDREGNTVTYRYVATADDSYIEKVSDTALGTGRFTSEEVALATVSFEVKGNGPAGDDGPERVLLHIRGTAGNNKTESKFNVQTLIVSRYLDVSELL